MWVASPRQSTFYWLKNRFWKMDIEKKKKDFEKDIMKNYIKAHLSHLPIKSWRVTV
jgi:hypothetical protein